MKPTEITAESCKTLYKKHNLVPMPFSFLPDECKETDSKGCCALGILGVEQNFYALDFFNHLGWDDADIKHFIKGFDAGMTSGLRSDSDPVFDHALKLGRELKQWRDSGCP